MWLPLAIIGHTAKALGFLSDKIFVEKLLPRPRMLAFLSGAGGILYVAVMPWFLEMPSYGVLAAALVAGAVGVPALLYFYRAVARDEISRVVPAIGSMVPVITFALSYVLLGERFDSRTALAFAFLVAGGILVAWHSFMARFGEQDSHWHQVEKPENETISRRDDEAVSGRYVKEEQRRNRPFPGFPAGRANSANLLCRSLLMCLKAHIAPRFANIGQNSLRSIDASANPALLRFKNFSLISLEVWVAFLFALSAVLMKYAFEGGGDISGFLWSRLGSVGAALFLMADPEVRNRLRFYRFRKEGLRTEFIFLATRILTGIAPLIVWVAIALGSVSLVNALQGIQYPILFILALLFSRRWPQIFKEEMAWQSIAQKSAATLLIAIGLALLIQL
jgi:drug/metabolite transporter (DMT)-like permease